MNHETAVSNAKDIADRVLAPAARENDKAGRFSSDAVKALGPAGLLGIMLPAEMGGAARLGRARSRRSSARSPKRTRRWRWFI
jgi:alkylation response protein AidB-like acyl-CoA dehydrogenase